MTFGLGHVGAIDETTPSRTTDPIEHGPKLTFEGKVFSCTKIRTVVARPGFVYGICSDAKFKLNFTFQVAMEEILQTCFLILNLN